MRKMWNFYFGRGGRANKLRDECTGTRNFLAEVAPEYLKCPFKREFVETQIYNVIIANGGRFYKVTGSNDYDQNIVTKDVALVKLMQFCRDYIKTNKDSQPIVEAKAEADREKAKQRRKPTTSRSISKNRKKNPRRKSAIAKKKRDKQPRSAKPSAKKIAKRSTSKKLSPKSVGIRKISRPIRACRKPPVVDDLLDDVPSDDEEEIGLEKTLVEESDLSPSVGHKTKAGRVVGLVLRDNIQGGPTLATRDVTPLSVFDTFLLNSMKDERCALWNDLQNSAEPFDHFADQQSNFCGAKEGDDDMLMMPYVHPPPLDCQHSLSGPVISRV